MSSTNKKTQVTINSRLGLIVKAVRESHPTYGVNEAIEYLISRGSKVYLDEIGLSVKDLEDIQISLDEIARGESKRFSNIEEAIKYLNSDEE